MGNGAIVLFQQGHEKVFGIHLAVAIPLDVLVRFGGRVLRPLCESVKSHGFSLLVGQSVSRSLFQLMAYGLQLMAYGLQLMAIELEPCKTAVI